MTNLEKFEKILENLRVGWIEYLFGDREDIKVTDKDTEYLSEISWLIKDIQEDFDLNTLGTLSNEVEDGRMKLTFHFSNSIHMKVEPSVYEQKPEKLFKAEKEKAYAYFHEVNECLNYFVGKVTQSVKDLGMSTVHIVPHHQLTEYDIDNLGYFYYPESPMGASVECLMRNSVSLYFSVTDFEKLIADRDEKDSN